MNLLETVYNYIDNPYPLWKSEITTALVSDKLESLKMNGLPHREEYSTSWSINNNFANTIRQSVAEDSEFGNVYLEAPSDNLSPFYQEHGLIPNTYYDTILGSDKNELKKAFDTIGLIEPALTDVTKLVRCIQVLEQPDPEIDVSYSHPNSPFSIFVSVCNQSSNISNLRVAESIIHEAMHLKLTLIENVLPLVEPFKGKLYYSPWRDEKRPAQGVLHGAFVFRVVHDFYKSISKHDFSDDTTNFINERRNQIVYEISQLKRFTSCNDLTENGAILAKNLLPLN